MNLWFVTPAWQRYEMTAICLEQRNRVIDYLHVRGIEAHQVVIADDENLDIARAAGAATVEAPNVVAAKFNDGMEYAGKHGADWIVPIGSDSWIEPRYFDVVGDTSVTLTSPAYCAVIPTALAELCVSPKNPRHSAGPYIFHRSLLEPSGFRPSVESSVMVDASTIAGIELTNTITWKEHTVHPFQYIGFRVPPMMTSYELLWQRWAVSAHEPWSKLREYYPADLVERARRLMTA